MILFLDISSSCTGYTVATKDRVHHFGALWFEKDASIAEKCWTIYRFIINMEEIWKFKKVVFEQYSFNMSRRSGALVCPQMQGAVLVACTKLELDHDQITPQTWRKNCGIKKGKGSGNAVWKEPTKKYFDAKMEIPEKIESNITGNLRTTPYDVYDSLGIAEGWFKK